MKVLVIHNRYRIRGGEEASIELQVAALRRRGHTVLELTRDSRDLERLAWFEKIVHGLTIAYSPAAARATEGLVQSQQPDVAHVHNVWPLLSPAVYTTLHRLRVPVVQSVHNYRFLSASGTTVPGEAAPPSPSGSIYQTLVGMALHLHRRLGTFERCIDHCIYPTHESLEIHRQHGFGRVPATVVPHFVDVQAIRPAAAPGDYAVYLGRLTAEKGVDVLLQAMRQLGGVPLKVIGDGPQRSSLEAFARDHRLTQVAFLGRVDGDARFEILRQARLAVVPSVWREPFGMVAIEAAAAGVPVIASRIGGLPEVVRDGESGILVSPGDAGELVAAIRALWSDAPRLATLRRQARQLAEQKYSEESGCQALLQAYGSAIRTVRGQG